MEVELLRRLMIELFFGFVSFIVWQQGFAIMMMRSSVFLETSGEGLSDSPESFVAGDDVLMEDLAWQAPMLL